ncbi:ABC transporter permease, partial [uncultured Anaerococcus sp.]|uniref:ABC transporter permease n=1 Tax=uncultured Anaerococcus sp. TaxID=293428 RepID=UPI00288A8F1B
LEDTSSVLAIINTGKAYASMDALLENLNLVIVVITLISSVLASVVLYNITDINVSERKRELATIKVLGFFPKEVTSYIYREIFILTLIGIVLGFGLGYGMFRYIIALVAPRNIMLAYKLHPLSFIVSATITLGLSIIMLGHVHKKLKKIDMAEAMSSGE